MACEKVLKKLRKEYWYSIKAIEDHYQNGFDSDNFPRQVVKFIREFLLKLPSSQSYYKTISKYLNEDKKTIYPRIAYYIIDSRYQDLNHVFWAVDFNPLCNNLNNHELFELLKNHCNDFTKEQINRVLRWIQELDDYWEDNNEEKHPSSLKKMWLTALLPTDNPHVIKAFDKATELYPYEIEHPGFNGWMECVAGHISPLDYDSVMDMSLPEIINYYSTYNTTPISHRITDPTIEGLNDVIKDDIKSNIEKYTNNIEIIVDTPIGFQHTWILGLWQHCYDNKTFVDSADVLNVIYRIIDNASFWQSYTEDVSQWNNYKWFIHRVLCAINCGLDCHGNMYSVENLSLVKSIILYIYQNENEAEEVGERDITNKFINSYSGELYEAFIYYNVVAAYQYNSPIDSRWDSEIKNTLDAEISKNKKNPLFYYALGKEYSSLYWIDGRWTGQIIPINDIDNWIGFMTGFHLHHNTVITPTFEEFCERGQYEKFFQNRELFDATMQKRVIQYICVAFYYDGINFDIDSPLFAKILNNKDRSEYENILQFFSTTNKQQIPAEKVKELWRKLFSINKGLEDEVSRYFIGESYRWLKYFDNIDEEIKEWLTLSMTSLQPLSSSHVIRELSSFTQTNPEIVGELILALVTAESTIPHYSELEKIAKNLFETGNNEIAKQIANMCLKKNYLGLRETVSN